MALELSPNEQLGIQLSESAKTMAMTDFWKKLVEVLLNDEMNSLALLDNYLATEVHPDREEVMTLCLKWHARRNIRKLLLENVKQAQNYPTILAGQLFQQFNMSPQPLSEEAAAILLEYGEM